MTLAKFSHFDRTRGDKNQIFRTLDTTQRNYADAQTNCLTKFGNMGGLFEPRTSHTNQLVYDEARNVVNANFANGNFRFPFTEFWLGINSLANQG